MIALATVVLVTATIAEPEPVRLNGGALYTLTQVSRHADRTEAWFDGVPSEQPVEGKRPPRLHFSFHCDTDEYRLDDLVVQMGERQTMRLERRDAEAYQSIDDGAGFRPFFSAACSLV